MDKCISCKSKKWQKFLQIGKYTLVRCQKCDLIKTQIKNRDREQIDQEVYNQSYEDYYASPSKSAELKKRFSSRIQSFHSHLQDVSKILDIGCSYGFFLETAKKFGWKFVGLEPGKHTFKYLKTHYAKNEVFNTTLEDSKLKDKFDLISYWDVLEHIEDPVKELKLAKKLLNKNGYLIVQCPNNQSLAGSIARSKWPFWTPPDHLYHFTPQSLKSVIDQAGFKAIVVKTYSDQEEILLGVSSALQNSAIPYWNALINRSHDLVQKYLQVFLKPIINFEGRQNKGTLIFILAQVN